MGTLTVKLPAPLEARLEALVAKRGETKSVLVREAIEKLVSDPKASVKVSVHDLLKDFIGRSSGPRDLSTNPKHMDGFGE